MSEPTSWRLVVQERVGLRRVRPSWLLVWYRDERRLFDSRWVALDLVTERGARWLARVVRSAIEAELLAPPVGLSSARSHRAPIVWQDHGDSRFDESVCEHGGFVGHVGCRTAPRGTGTDYHLRVTCSAPTPTGFVDFHHLEIRSDVTIRTGDAGRFLAELIIDLAGAGRAIPPISAAFET
jgi:hypothetical protein